MSAHEQMQSDPELLQQARPEVLIARNALGDFRAAIHRLTLLQTFFLDALAQAVAGSK